MTEPRDHIDKARELLSEGQCLLAGGFPNGAGRSAYMAAFHAAHAFVVAQGSRAKSHKGVRIEFLRLAHEGGGVDRRFTDFLAQAYDFKAFADYDDGEPLTLAEAERSLAEAAVMVDGIEALVAAE